MACCTLSTHLKGLLSINLVILVVILFLEGEHFLVREEDVFVSVLGLPLVRRISFKVRVRRRPFERRCALMCRSSLMRHDFIGSIFSDFWT